MHGAGSRERILKGRRAALRPGGKAFQKVTATAVSKGGLDLPTGDQAASQSGR